MSRPYRTYSPGQRELPLLGFNTREQLPGKRWKAIPKPTKGARPISAPSPGRVEASGPIGRTQQRPARNFSCHRAGVAIRSNPVAQIAGEK